MGFIAVVIILIYLLARRVEEKARGRGLEGTRGQGHAALPNPAYRRDGRHHQRCPVHYLRRRTPHHGASAERQWRLRDGWLVLSFTDR